MFRSYIASATKAKIKPATVMKREIPAGHDESVYEYKVQIEIV